VYAAGVNGRLCVLMDEVGCFEFWSFCVDPGVMRAYVGGADGHVSPCLGGLFFWRSVVDSCSYLLFSVTKFLVYWSLFMVLFPVFFFRFGLR
jgi:hypothetical protein